MPVPQIKCLGVNKSLTFSSSEYTNGLEFKQLYISVAIAFHYNLV